MLNRQKLSHAILDAYFAAGDDLAGCERSLIVACNLVWQERHGDAAAKRRHANRPWGQHAPNVTRLVPRQEG